MNNEISAEPLSSRCRDTCCRLNLGTSERTDQQKTGFLVRLHRYKRTFNPWVQGSSPCTLTK